MKNKTKRILAYIALVFMAVFTVTLVVFLITRGNVEAFVTLFSGFVGLVLFFTIKALDKKSEPAQEIGGEDGSDPAGDEELTQENADEDAENVTQESVEENTKNSSQESEGENAQLNT